VAYGWASRVKTFQLNDNDTAPASGSVKFRALNPVARPTPAR
jgi:hypothetical protein